MTTKPKLGQNFLIDPSASLAIVEALGDISAATVSRSDPAKAQSPNSSPRVLIA